MAAAVSYAIPSRPDPQRLVNDLAKVFTPEQVSTLENTLVAFDDSTSNQIVVVTVKDRRDTIHQSLLPESVWSGEWVPHNSIMESCCL